MYNSPPWWFRFFFFLVLVMPFCTTYMAIIKFSLPASGLSLKSQELTAIFLAVRLVCSFMLEGDIHTLLDFATLIFTAWVVFMIRYKLKSTYIKELDNFPIYYMVNAFFSCYIYWLNHVRFFSINLEWMYMLFLFLFFQHYHIYTHIVEISSVALWVIDS